MSTLLQLQQNLQRHVMRGNKNIYSSIAIKEGESKESSMMRLHIYRNAYEARLIEALSSNYPCLTSYMGDEDFAEMSSLYIHDHPSTYRSIRWFGDKLPDFLESYAHEKAEFLKELAEFEWKTTLAFDARDASCISVNEMAAISPECWAEMTLSFHPSIQRINLSWNSVAIWEAMMSDAPKLPNIQKTATEETWVLWRFEHYNRYCLLTVDEALAFDAASRGMTFGDVLEGLCQWHRDEAAGLVGATFLKGWIQSGWVHEINI